MTSREIIQRTERGNDGILYTAIIDGAEVWRGFLPWGARGHSIARAQQFARQQDSVAARYRNAEPPGAGAKGGGDG